MKTTDAITLIETAAQRLCPGWVIDEANREAVTACGAWLAREPRPGLDLGKGLLLMGNVGTGKTLLMRAIREAMRDAYGAQFGIRSCQELVRMFADDGYDAVNPWLSAPHACFDDLGTEAEGVNYGNRTNLLAEVIEARYERMTAGRKCWTHITTNLSTDAIRTRYGGRAYSRLQHMCNLIDLGAASESIDRRRGAPAPALVLEPRSADNVYEVMHPRVAERIGEALRHAVAEVSATPPAAAPQRAASPSREDDLAAFADRCRAATDEALMDAATRIAGQYTLGTAQPWLEVIEREVERRKAVAA